MRLSLCQIDGSMSLPLKKKKKKTHEQSKKKRRSTRRFGKISGIGLYVEICQFLSKSLFLFLKTKFSFGKTNRIRFYKEFLTPYMKLGVRVPDSQILFENYQIKILLIFCPIFFSIKIHDSTKSNTSMESLTLPIK